MSSPRIGTRLTERETEKVKNLIFYIDCSPHEWPSGPEDIQLLCHGFIDQLTRIAQLETQLAEARRDSARLDWLISHDAAACTTMAGLSTVIVSAGTEAERSVVETVYRTPRAAIDAAMKERA